MPISGRSPRQDTYSHLQPQAQEASAQGQSAPQPQLLQPQEQPWVVGVVSVIVDLRSVQVVELRPPSSYLLTHGLRNYYTPALPDSWRPTPLAELRKAPLTNSSANAP